MLDRLNEGKAQLKETHGRPQRRLERFDEEEEDFVASSFEEDEKK